MLLTSVRISTVINTIELYFQFNKKIYVRKKKKKQMNCVTQLNLLYYLNHMWLLLELNNLLFSKEQLGNCLIHKTESNVITNRGAEVILCSHSLETKPPLVCFSIYLNRMFSSQHVYFTCLKTCKPLHSYFFCDFFSFKHGPVSACFK